jgi:hypothetical protein
MGDKLLFRITVCAPPAERQRDPHPAEFAENSVTWNGRSSVGRWVAFVLVVLLVVSVVVTAIIGSSSDYPCGSAASYSTPDYLHMSSV